MRIRGFGDGRCLTERGVRHPSRSDARHDGVFKPRVYQDVRTCRPYRAGVYSNAVEEDVVELRWRLAGYGEATHDRIEQVAGMHRDADGTDSRPRHSIL